MLTVNDSILDIDIGLTQAFATNEAFMPDILATGIFGTPLLVPYEWATHNLVRVTYTMGTDTFVKGASTANTATVLPTIQSKYKGMPATAGLIRASIKYHKDNNAAIGGNIGCMHVSEVEKAYSAWIQDMAKRVNICLLTQYRDLALVTNGLKGLKDFSKEIDAPSIDPSSYENCYSFFAIQIESLCSKLLISRDRVLLLIGIECVIRMKAVSIGYSGISVWSKLTEDLFSSIQVKILDTVYYGNECMFVAIDRVSVVTIDKPFTSIIEDKSAVGPLQFIRYIEGVLPSMVAYDENACMHQSNLLIPAANRNATDTKGLYPKKNGKSDIMKNDIISL